MPGSRPYSGESAGGKLRLLPLPQSPPAGPDRKGKIVDSANMPLTAATEGIRKRWAWDLYPLAKDSWGAWELEDDEQRKDHRVYMRRHKGDGYLGPPLSNAQIFLLMERGAKPDDFAVREGYVPKADDVALLKRLYPDADPYRPAWYTIKADLVAVGSDGDRLDQSEAPTLLALLRTREQSTVATSNGDHTPQNRPD